MFILADDLGWSDTTLYGTTRLYDTPNIQRLAREGMTFTRAYAASPLCSPTRASILTGLSPARTGITLPYCHLPVAATRPSLSATAPPTDKVCEYQSATRLTTDRYTLGAALKEAGYATGHFGKWHLGPEPYSPLEHGFDVDVPHWPGPDPGTSYIAPWSIPNFESKVPNEHIEDRIADEAVAFMEAHQDRPFFLNYWQFSVHTPFDAKPDGVQEYRGRVDPRDSQRSPTYAAMVRSLDQNVGKVLDAIDRLGLTERTIVIFYSDNGGNEYNFVDGTAATDNAPLRGGKGTIYEGGIRVPCVVRQPGRIAANSRSDAMLQSVDFFPTILDLLGIAPDPPRKFDGVSIVPALRSESSDRGAIFTFFPHTQPVPDALPAAVSVHLGDWKLIRLIHDGDDGEDRFALYNLAFDLGETNDRADEFPGRVAYMNDLISQFLQDTDALVPPRNPAYDPTAESMKGWTARGCDAIAKNDVLTVLGRNGAPFLGIIPGAFTSAKLSLRVRAAYGGAGTVGWLPADKLQADAINVPFTIDAGEWETLEIDVPVDGTTGILRLFLPAQDQTVEVDWIELHGNDGVELTWDF